MSPRNSSGDIRLNSNSSGDIRLNSDDPDLNGGICHVFGSITGVGDRYFRQQLMINRPTASIGVFSSNAGPFAYLSAVQENEAAVSSNAQDWLPWN